MVLGLGAVEQAQDQALVRVAHGLALGAVAQVGVDAAGEDLLEALVAAVVGVDVGVGHDLGDELVLDGARGAGDRLAGEVLDALDGVAAHGEDADERLVVAAGEVEGLLALGVGAHRHGERRVAGLDGGQSRGELLRLEVVDEVQARGHLVGDRDIEAADLLGAVGLGLEVAVGGEGVVAHERELGALDGAGAGGLVGGLLGALAGALLRRTARGEHHRAGGEEAEEVPAVD